MSQPFKFKQFIVHQDRCAMKIGTDGVLLGAWTSIDHEPKNILDIGAGTGIIALQLAQRSSSYHNQVTCIDAIEVNSNAFEQCVENFEASPWNNLLFCYHTSLEEFTVEMPTSYELIVSNPPYHDVPMVSSTNNRSQARSNQALPFDELVRSVSKLLSKKGVFSLIIPYSEEVSFIGKASQQGLYPFRICRVRGHINADFKRSLIEFTKKASDLRMEELTIEHARHEYTQDYIGLVREFYLKM